MIREEYETLCKDIGVKGNWDAYEKCIKEFEKYLNSALEIQSETFIIIFLESCPENTNNYIFSSLGANINSKTDSYLWNIYRGFFPNGPASVKRNILNALLGYTTKKHVAMPVFIMDLFPFHGIDLAGKRHKLCDVLQGSNANLLLLEDVIGTQNLLNSYKKIFLFGLPYTIWNRLGGLGIGSLYNDGTSKKNGLLGKFDNNKVIVNVGGQNISQVGIQSWRKYEGIE